MRAWLKFIDEHVEEIARIIYKIKRELRRLEIKEGMGDE